MQLSLGPASGASEMSQDMCDVGCAGGREPRISSAVFPSAEGWLCQVGGGRGEAEAAASSPEPQRGLSGAVTGLRAWGGGGCWVPGTSPVVHEQWDERADLCSPSWCDPSTPETSVGGRWGWPCHPKEQVAGRCGQRRARRHLPPKRAEPNRPELTCPGQQAPPLLARAHSASRLFAQRAGGLAWVS